VDSNISLNVDLQFIVMHIAILNFNLLFSRQIYPPFFSAVAAATHFSDLGPF
jgi:hypothetical protein